MRPSGTLPTDRRFNGQRWEQGLGLYDYNARWYHPALGRFASADTVVPEPGNPQSLNRYAYVYNNPQRYMDPSGHIPIVYYDSVANSIIVVANIQIYGPGASAAVARDYEAAIERIWNDGEPTCEGKPVFVEWAMKLEVSSLRNCYKREQQNGWKIN
jgi:RHS repeat-associated protein